VTAPALLPPVVLGLTVATMLAAFTHLWLGGSLRSLLSLWLLIQLGFWAADIAAALFRAPLYTIGDLQIVAATTGGLAISILKIVTRKRV
jgi:hypothetical protein